MALTNTTNNDAAVPEESATLQASAGAESGPSKHVRLRTIAARAKAKTRGALSLPSQDHALTSSGDEDDLFADAAFNAYETAEYDSGPSNNSSDGVISAIESAAKMLLHPRRAMRHKATKSTAGQISTASKPRFSSSQQRNFLDAHDRLTTAKSNSTSLHASESTAESTDTDVEIARKRVDRYEDQRESIQIAWILGRHVDRVRIVQWSVPQPQRIKCTVPDPAAPNHDNLDWSRYLARLLVWYSYGFTAPYIDDLEYPPFDINDLTLLVERFLAISGPWQTFFLSCRQIYTWQSPRRTMKWAVLFWTLWYTNHIVGYFYFWVIYTTIRNRYYPSSVQDIRESMARGVDRTEKAKAWSELISYHGRDSWLEPLLDELGPIIQLQLKDTTDFLEVLSNFYRWERPGNTGRTLFVFLMLLLITLLCDMQTCVKFLWMFIGGGFFFIFPIATNYPKYRKIVNLIGWFFWNIPNHAELAIIRLQEKARETEAKSTKIKNETSDYDTANSSPGHEPGKRTSKTTYTFHAYNGKARGTLHITRSGLQWSPKSSSPPIHIPFTHLREMRKLEPSSQSKSTKLLRPNTEGLFFIYTAESSASAPSPAASKQKDGTAQIALHVKWKRRHEIFSLVLAWSGQKWQPLPIERHKDKIKQQQTFDKALKRVMP